MAVPPRILPALDPLNRPFWTGGAECELRIARCAACAVWIHPPMPRCPVCGSAEVAAAPVSGAGRVATFSVNHQPWLPGMAPFVLAAVELAEQAELYVMTNIVGCPPEEVRIGMPVHVRFEAQEDVFLPFFAPAEA